MVASSSKTKVNLFLRCSGIDHFASQDLPSKLSTCDTGTLRIEVVWVYEHCYEDKLVLPPGPQCALPTIFLMGCILGGTKA